MPTVYELDVRLRDITPPIWRTVEVPGSATLEEVHYALQVAMGWTNSHLHQFSIGKRSIGMADSDDAPAGLEDERRVRLSDVAKQGERFVYEYDFGDGWEHDVEVRRVTEAAKAEPRCTAGARACPPEDCGGPGGYERMLEVLANPAHPEHEDLLQWLGDGFEPEAFELPSSGRGLSEEMAELHELADADSPDGDPIANELGLPSQLIDALLELAPQQRAGLATLLVASLAQELEHVEGQLQKLARQRAPAKRGATKRGTSKRTKRR